MARVIVQRWPEDEHYAKSCKNCDYALGVHHGVVACPQCGEIHLSRHRFAKIGKVLSEAFPNSRIVSGPQWPGYVRPREIRGRPALPNPLPNLPTDDESAEILQLFDPDSWQDIG